MIKPAATELTARARGGSLILRHPRWAEFEDWAALRRENRDYLTPWEPEWTKDHLSRPAYKARLLRFKKMIAAVQPDNERSIRLLEAIGFQHEGRARGALKINGVWQDHEIYALLSSDG